MKKILSIIVVALALAGCSNNEVPPEVIVLPSPEAQNALSKFTLKINDQTLKRDSLTSVSAYRTDDKFTVYFGEGSNSSITFDLQGRLGRFMHARIVIPSSILARYYSRFHNSEQYFTFDLMSVDTINRRVKGSFSGYLNRDPLNFTGDSKFTTGIFDMRYADVPPSIKALKHTAKINGNDWHMINSYFSKGEANDNNNILVHDFMDNEYQVMIGYNLNNFATGTFAFTSASYFNMVRVAKYDMATQSFVNYNTSGTLAITQKEQIGGILYILSGTYTATAVNPDNAADVIQVTNGKFKFVTPNPSNAPY
jgi:hypothetical protein